MKISNLKYKIVKNSAILSADITPDGENPVNIYFEVDKKFSDYIYADYSPFYAFMMMPCMTHDIDLELDGSISRKLYKANIKVQKLLLSWGNFYPINITTKTAIDDGNPKNIASFFSLGVDSFYTYLKNKSGSEKIDHLILVHGFDVKPGEKALFKQMKKNSAKICKIESIKLITVRTNLRDITDQYFGWDWAHGGALAAVALLLRRRFRKVYFSGPHAKSQLMPLGNHPDLNYLWSSEQMNIVSIGTEHTRLEKIKFYISNSPLALKYIKVCWENIGGQYNCCQCDKCLRTMVDLKLSDALEQAKTFPRELSIKKVRAVYSPESDIILFIADSLDEVIKQQRFPELREALEHSLQISQNPSIRKRVMRNIGTLDRKYNNARLYFFLSRIGVNV